MMGVVSKLCETVASTTQHGSTVAARTSTKTNQQEVRADDTIVRYSAMQLHSQQDQV